MERLTEWNGGQTRHAYYPRCFKEPCYGNECKINDCPFETAVCDRLAAYEDIGLTPEEIKASFTEDTMINLAAQALGVEPSRLRELAEVDKDGRVVVLPCKVGDTVYFALLGRIIEKQVFSIVSFSNSTRIYCGGTSEYFRPEDIGKTFFLTREEAEKALQEMEGKEEGCDE